MWVRFPLESDPLIIIYIVNMTRIRTNAHEITDVINEKAHLVSKGTETQSTQLSKRKGHKYDIESETQNTSMKEQ